MGGAFAASNLRKKLQKSVDIHVYEKSSSVGGRASGFPLEAEGRFNELGASIIWSKNRYMREASEEHGLGIQSVSDEGSSAIYDGTQFVLTDRQWWITKAMRFGLAPLLWAREAMSVYQNHFAKIYELQDAGAFFDTPRALLEAVGLFDLTQKSCADHLASITHRWPWGGRRFANEIAGAINKCNYNQKNEDLTALAGLVSFMPEANGDVWSVPGGNERVAVALLNSTYGHITFDVDVSVKQKERDPFFYLMIKTGRGGGGKGEEEEEEEEVGPFDAVIIAHPLHLLNTNFSDCRASEDLNPSQRTVVTYVSGNLQASFFHVPTLPAESIYRTNDADRLPFSSITYKGPYNSSHNLYKVFSEELLNSSTLADLFGASSEVVRVKNWLAYPHYAPPELMPIPFKLGEGLCYVNAIERAASAMEMSAIGGRNCALMIADFLKGRIDDRLSQE